MVSDTPGSENRSAIGARVLEGALPRRYRFLLAAALGLSSFARADEVPVKYQVLSPRADGIIATGINSGGDVIGFEWVEEKARPGVVEQKPFLARANAITYLPLLEGYTATFPAAISDNGLVVGRAGKPGVIGVRTPLRNQAFLWDAKEGMRGLGVLKDDWASFACGISRDGRTISGFSVGDDRVRACVWDRDGEAWKATPLPHTARLGSNTVAISGDGRQVSAVDGLSPYLWSRNAEGAWTSEQIGDPGSLIPRAVNDSGVVVGQRDLADGSVHAVLWTRDSGLQVLEEPKGYTRSEALAVNNLGTVVGMVDGPRGSKIGPNAFVLEKGRPLRLLEEGGAFLASATAINDRGQVAGVLESPDEVTSLEPAPNTKAK
jgi:uncharacterized membrane protein